MTSKDLQGDYNLKAHDMTLDVDIELGAEK